MRLAVALTVNNRLDYLKQVLDSWSKVEGIGEIPMWLSLEPGHREVREFCEGWIEDNETQPRGMGVNVTPLGPHRNPYNALAKVFYAVDADFVILGEDDSIVSTDVLDYFIAMAARFDGVDDVFTICASNLNCGACCDRSNHVRRGKFCSTVWGLWDYRWEEVRETWGFDYSDHGGWDMKFTEVVKGRRDCLLPCVSRAQHIGQYGGVHMRPEEFEQMRSQCFDPDPNRTEAWSVMRSYQ